MFANSRSARRFRFGAIDHTMTHIITHEIQQHNDLLDQVSWSGWSRVGRNELRWQPENREALRLLRGIFASCGCRGALACPAPIGYPAVTLAVMGDPSSSHTLRPYVRRVDRLLHIFRRSACVRLALSMVFSAYFRVSFLNKKYSTCGGRGCQTYTLCSGAQVGRARVTQSWRRS